ncbi:MAG TPA: 3'-5' exoribonuclease, partial [Rhodocyclaceae bacterium]|nr:3'-5' exoribonuclease [Rhodocyclaceae bacterium]
IEYVKEIYISTDVETDGPVAGNHSMVSIGSAANSADKSLLSTFSANLETLPGSTADARTAAWWATQPEAWSACRQNLESPRDAMTRYLAWLKALPARPVFVAYPAPFDFSFVHWYLMRFAGENPFGYSAIDIKTYAMALMRKPYRACGKRSMPAEWFDPVAHTHVALDDAIEQGSLFCNMLRANLEPAGCLGETGPANEK